MEARPPATVDANFISPPTHSDKRSRACIGCKLVKTFDQFIEDGCENCQHLALKDDRERVSECTTTSYSGVVSLLSDENASWVGKWLHLGKYACGCYALQLQGSLITPVDKPVGRT
ncbi:Transcription initiation Spt4-like [Ostreococcus tauri]|uniref:Transcription initiation Spt4-like n=1 Tax=Ostreococcus tauri TaxID=70448 RepID=Q01ET3_OSTTA|nr:Transcription initiation Spt4-like [Ostreococcus tauri]CAL52169.2 Transcription initiation Spt4-like [Ostreococcus tauri]|eukprot:XP_003074901.1 Transcription initiation Spt4-like [Ostreococcus tauri]